MNTQQNFIILTDKTLFANSNLLVDWQMSTSHRNSLESDCACVTSVSISPETNQKAITKPYLLNIEAVDKNVIFQQNGHLQSLTDNYYLSFDIHGHNGLAVINQPTYRLVQKFADPRPLLAELEQLPPSAEVKATIQHLIQTGLLKSVDESAKVKQKAEEHGLTAWLHVTNDCNLDCPYCYVAKTADKMALEKGYQSVAAVFRSAVKQNFKLVKLKYAGGEATLNFHTVLALHRYAHQLADEHGLALDGVVLSNGVAISDRMITAMKDLGLRLMISLDGVGAYHDVQRPFVNGHGSFFHLERTLDRLARHQLIPSISITLSRHNLAGLPDVVAYVLERNLPFTLNFFRDNDACGVPNHQLRYEEDQLIEAMLAAFKVIEDNLPPYSLLGNLLDLAHLDNFHEHTCGVGHSYMVINHKGGVAKCHMALDQTVATVNDDNPLQAIQLDHIGIQNLPVTEKEGCKTCEWQNWCAGGCPALTYRMTGRYDIKSPNCRIYKTLFPEVLRLEGLRLLKYSNLLSG